MHLGQQNTQSQDAQSPLCKLSRSVNPPDGIRVSNNPGWAQVGKELAENDMHASLQKFPGPLVSNADSKLLTEFIDTTIEALKQSQSDTVHDAC